jgi:TRAP-type mannitol/chloroaromatic compound transport system permease small subunit
MDPHPTFLGLLIAIAACLVAYFAVIAFLARGRWNVDTWLHAVDRLNTAIGKLGGWAILILTFAICYEVFVRFVLRAPTTWAFDASYMLYGTLFMLAGPYTLARNGHVRGDFLYRAWAPRRQATLDLALYILFFFPGILALAWTGYNFANFSWIINEHSSNSPNGPPLYHFKSLIPIVGGLMILQGLAEVVRCVICLRTGAWPQRLLDVEETERLILEQAEAGKAAGTTGKV